MKKLETYRAPKWSLRAASVRRNEVMDGKESFGGALRWATRRERGEGPVGNRLAPRAMNVKLWPRLFAGVAFALQRPPSLSSMDVDAPVPPEELLVTRRPRRSTAGNRWGVYSNERKRKLNNFCQNGGRNGGDGIGRIDEGRRG